MELGLRLMTDLESSTCIIWTLRGKEGGKKGSICCLGDGVNPQQGQSPV